MNRTKLKNYAPQARRDFIQAATDRAAYFGLTATKVEPVTQKGDSVLIGGKAFPRKVGEQRKRLEERVRQHGLKQTMEALAYTWFNRLVAIRFMELHDYLENAEGGASYRVLSNPDKDKPTPEILEKAENVTLESLDRQKVIDLKLDGTKEVELYRLLLIAECNALNAAMPFLFERIDDDTELVLPDNLLHSDSLIRKLVNEIDEEDWQQVEIIGWLYQFYISEKKDEVIGKVVASEDIPAATQLFTPNWIVKYLVQNTLGRQWLATYPHSALRQQMAYYIEPAEQTPEVQEQLRAITPTILNPEEITLLDPACGSGHILVEAYDLFKAIYQERGYRAKDIPRLILQKNLFGLEIDDRAAQLAAFALMMKARADDRRIFSAGVQPQVLALQDSLPYEQLKSLIGEETSFAKEIYWLHGQLRGVKTYGSLLGPDSTILHFERMEEFLRLLILEAGLFTRPWAELTLKLLNQYRLLANHYDCVAANPPYMGSKYYTPNLKAFVDKKYKIAKADLYACFLQRNATFAKHGGFVGMITIPNWMFLSSFEDVRKAVLTCHTIDTFIHNGRGVFGSDFGTCSFVFRSASFPAYRGTYRRLFDKPGSVSDNQVLQERFLTSPSFSASSEDFQSVPGSPLAYWIGNRTRNAFKVAPALGTLAHVKIGMRTGNDSNFLRLWHEVAVERIGFGVTSASEAMNSGCKWFPFSKGGEYRKWYGNAEYVVNWEHDGQEIKEETRLKYPQLGDNLAWKISNEGFYFRKGLTWSNISISLPSFRMLDEGFIIGTKGPGVYSTNGDEYRYLAFLNSSVTTSLLSFLSPSVGFEIGQIGVLPFLSVDDAVEENAKRGVELARNDWDAFENSWGFQILPSVRYRSDTLAKSQEVTDAECRERFSGMKELEEENNFVFIHAYDLQGELSLKVSEEEITLYRPNRLEDIKRLLSYAIGCMMGRYSLDKRGLIYAHSGNVGFDPNQYKTFPADEDGIVPLLDADWGIRDDAADRIVEFISVAWPREHLEENLKFISESLGPTKNEHSRDTIRRYLATGFYKDHLRWYKRRPIYWLFSSGKQRAFQSLVYLHRYHEGTLARMRTEYVIPLQGKIAAHIEQLEGDKNKATSTSHRKKLQKEQDDLKKQQAELFAFDEKLKHAADQKIALDLDDGVKVNYGKFGDLLAEVKAVTGGKDEE